MYNSAITILNEGKYNLNQVKIEQQHLYQTREVIILDCEQSNVRVSRVTSREFPKWRACSQASFFRDRGTKKWVGKNKA